MLEAKLWVARSIRARRVSLITDLGQVKSVVQITGRILLAFTISFPLNMNINEEMSMNTDISIKTTLKSTVKGILKVQGLMERK